MSDLTPRFSPPSGKGQEKAKTWGQALLSPFGLDASKSQGAKTNTFDGQDGAAVGLWGFS